MSLPTFLPARAVAERTLAMQGERAFPVAALWRAASFGATGGEPMTVRRAMALNAVLDACDLPLTPGELLVGSGLGRLAAEGPHDELAAAREVLSSIGGRHFGTHADHAAPDYASLLREGLNGMRSRALGAARATDARSGAEEAGRRAAFLRSVALAIEGLARHAARWAERCAREAAAGGAYSELLSTQAAMLRRLASEPPRTLHEAMQLMLLAHCAFQLDDRGAMALGRVDQYLYPFYEEDLAAGRVTPDGAQTLFDHLFAKLAHRGDIQNVCVGGLTPEGSDGTNALSFCCVRAAMRIGQPGANLTARVHRGTPPEFLRACGETIRTGIGFPALFNDDVQVPVLVEQGYPLEEARDYCFVGCIEVFIPGRQAPWADSRFNLLRCVDLALRGGRDGLTGEQAGPRTGAPASWPDLREAFLAQMRAGLRAHVDALNAMKREAEARADDLTSPLMSALTADCIERGLDVCAGGARHPANHGVAGMGIGSTADALMAAKRLVFEERRAPLERLIAALDDDWRADPMLRRAALDAPKYGNDDEQVDALASDVATAFGGELLGHRTPRGGRYWALMAANVQNVSSGREVGATPDGRRAREPLSDAASPAFGRDRQGPTAVARSVARLDYRLAPGGNVVNMKFHPSALAGEDGLAALAALVRTCFDLGGVQLQFNTTDRALLREAMEHPERHAGLVVRVSGFSAYFVGLERAVQEDILERTEHGFA